MATIDLGKLGFVNKGTYSSSTSYEKNDLVQYTDSGILSTYLYINASAATGQTPSTSGTVNGTYWAYYAKGVADAVAGAGNNKVLVTNSSGSLAPVSIGSAGQFLRTNSSANGFEFGTVQTKLLGQTIVVDDTGINLGNVNRTKSQITQLNVSHTAQSTSSYFVVRAHLHGGSPNHQKFVIEWSKDNSNWYHNTEAGNAGFESSTPSGSGVSWSSDRVYQYPQMSVTTDADSNRNAPATCAFVLTPGSGNTHSVSTLYLKTSCFCTNDTSDMFYNRNGGNSSNDGTICTSSVEVTEYAL